jgi:1-acyl-sn-glycerol-3-phosphate acyltransferase
VSNHQGSFMDPLFIASQRKPIVFFMTRSDVFNKFSKPFLWAAHMLPIYRQRDGVDTKVKNAKIFEKTNIVLNGNRNILIFGEGFTDDRIQRRLHPIKKGPARIGFSALEYTDWNKEIYLQGLGVNYTDFNLRRSDVLIAAGKRIRLNDFRADFEENPAKTITEVTRILEADMRSLVTDVHDPDWADVHEDLMMFTRKGMHPTCFDDQFTLEERWQYSISLANWINGLSEQQRDDRLTLVNQIKSYKNQLEALKITENERYLSQTNAWNSSKSLFRSILFFPFSVLGALHAGWITLLIKKWVEKAFKRPVFWGSTKKVLAIFIVLIVNLPLLFILPHYLPWSNLLNWMVSCVYFLALGLFAQAFLMLLSDINYLKRLRYVKSIDLSEINREHAAILQKIHADFPVA